MRAAGSPSAPQPRCVNGRPGSELGKQTSLLNCLRSEWQSARTLFSGGPAQRADLEQFLALLLLKQFYDVADSLGLVLAGNQQGVCRLDDNQIVHA